MIQSKNLSPEDCRILEDAARELNIPMDSAQLLINAAATMAACKVMGDLCKRGETR